MEYILTHEAWYGKVALQRSKAKYEILIHIGDAYECVIAWSDLGPCLTMYSAAWPLFIKFRDLFDGLAQCASKYTVGTVVKILKDCGFADKTERVNPGNSKVCSACGRTL